MSRTLAAVLIAVALVATLTAARPAQADADPSGSWNLFFGGPFGIGDCPSTILVNGGGLKVELCTGLSLGGNYDKGTGEFFAIDAQPSVGIFGEISPDGNTLSGSWQATFPAFEGPLSGTRKGSETPTQPAPVGGVSLEPDVNAAMGNEGVPQAPIIVLPATGGIAAIAADWCWAKRRRGARRAHVRP